MIMTLEQLRDRIEEAIEELGDDYVVIQGDKIGNMRISAPESGKYSDFVYLKGNQAYLKEAFDVAGIKPINKALNTFDNILLFKKEHLSEKSIKKLEESIEDSEEGSN